MQPKQFFTFPLFIYNFLTRKKPAYRKFLKNNRKSFFSDYRQSLLPRFFKFSVFKHEKRTTFTILTIFTLFLSNILFFSNFVFADEGMWLFSNPPKKMLKEKYNFDLTDEFLTHLQKSSIRFSNGGSGSFVSSGGLIMTNHHVAYSSIQKLSTPEKDYLHNGFFAASNNEELSCRGLELIVLDLIQDVTEQVNRAVAKMETTAEAETARRAVINRLEEEAFNQIEKNGLDKSKYRCEVVPFYQGAIYHLYVYQKLEDVRLVFAPEENAGFFGGDPDNFEFPRFNLDVAFFRAYENGIPYKPSHFLKWSAAGAQLDELVFVSGHPGRTNRTNTAEHLIFQRDKYAPLYLNKFRRLELLLQNYAEQGPDEALYVAGELFRLKNSRKNRSGILLGLQTPALIEKKRSEDKKLYDIAVQKKLIDLKKNDPWSYIYEALSVYDSLFLPYDMFENGSAFDSKLFQIARKIVRRAAEKRKKNALRLPEYRDISLNGIRDDILAEDPIRTDLEILRLSDSLSFYLENLDLEYPSEGNEGLNLLEGRSPRELAARLINGTKLTSVEERQRLMMLQYDDLILENDPMIRFVLKTENIARDYRTRYDQQVSEPLRQAYSMIARLQFKAFGMNSYPDATFTLRLAIGKIKGYQDENGRPIPAWTNFADAFEHQKKHRNISPYILPESWHKNKNAINLNTPLNIVSTNDIIGGNSGSPLVNKNGEVVGLIFDGNIQSLVSNFIYTEEQARAISVHSSAILESLKHIYHTDRIVNELGK